MPLEVTVQHVPINIPTKANIQVGKISKMLTHCLHRMVTLDHSYTCLNRGLGEEGPSRLDGHKDVESGGGGPMQTEMAQNKQIPSSTNGGQQCIRVEGGYPRAGLAQPKMYASPGLGLSPAFSITPCSFVSRKRTAGWRKTSNRSRINRGDPDLPFAGNSHCANPTSKKLTKCLYNSPVATCGSSSGSAFRSGRRTKT